MMINRIFLVFTVLFMSGGLFTPLAYADITTGLIGHWGFEEGTGSITEDLSGNHADADFINSATWAGNGYIGDNSLLLNGDFSYVDTNADVLNGASSFTLSAWMKRNATDSWVSFSKSIDSNTSRMGMIFWANGNYYVNVSNGSNRSDNIFSNDTDWHHVALVFDGSLSSANRVTGYFDGVNQNLSANWPTVAPVLATNFEIGRWWNGSLTRYSDGQIDDARIYNRALTPEDIVELYTYTGEVDVTEPVISNITVSTTATTATITWATDESTTSTVNYGTNSNYGSASSSLSFVTSHSITLTGLDESTSYYYQVVSSDIAGNVAVSSDMIFITDEAAGDVTAPTITNISSDKVNGIYTINEVIDIDVTFSEAVTSTGNVTVTLETGDTDRTCTFTVTGASSGTCNYTVQAGDTSSDLNVNSVSGTINDASANAMVNFTPATNLAANKALVIDTTAPVISNITTSATANTAIITWATGEPATSAVNYGETSDYGGTSFSGSFVTSHSITLTGLDESTSYHYQVVSSDIAGNVAVSNDVVFITTEDTGDVIYPSAPANLSATSLSSAQISLSWDASIDNVAVASYNIYRNGILLNNNIDTTYTDTNLTSSTTYSYTVSAVDTSGNESAESTAGTVTTFFLDTFTTSACDETVESFGSGWIVNNELSIPDVGKRCNRYYANLLDNTNNITLHFKDKQGRLDAVRLTFPFTYIARNIGIGTQANTQIAPSSSGNPAIFAGVQVHVIDLESRNSSHVVVGHRGSIKEFTIEGKNTVDGTSTVDDEGDFRAPDGRADIRIVGNSSNDLVVSWQTPNTDPTTIADNWILYGNNGGSNGNGDLPGNTPNYGEEVYVGLITYAAGTTGVPFVGTADSVEITTESLVEDFTLPAL